MTNQSAKNLFITVNQGLIWEYEDGTLFIVNKNGIFTTHKDKAGPEILKELQRETQ